MSRKSLQENQFIFQETQSRGWQPRWLTLRLRLALFISVLLIALCLALVLFINITAAIIQPGQLGGLSLIGLVLAVLFGGIGAYWLAGIALRPVRQMSAAARQISAQTLSTRLPWNGPRDELQELSEAFNAMLGRLENSFDQQGRFVADAAHELRTPLASLRTNLEVVMADPHTTLSDYQGMAVTLERSLTRLEGLIEALLVLTTEERSLVREEILLLPLLEDVLSNLELVARQHQIFLSLNYCAREVEEARVCGDGSLIAQLFSNLLENAIRYNHKGGQARVEVCTKNDWVIVQIVDDGVGIKTDEQTHIFERFYRVDSSRSRHKGGAGLGLSLVDYIVRQHRGSLELRSQLGAGTTFRVQLPLVTTNKPE